MSVAAAARRGLAGPSPETVVSAVIRVHECVMAGLRALGEHAEIIRSYSAPRGSYSAPRGSYSAPQGVDVQTAEGGQGL